MANRRVELAWKWAGWSVFSLAAAGGVAWWVARSDTKPVDPGSRDVGGLTDELARALPADAPRLRFADVSAGLGFSPQFVGTRTQQLPEDMGGGLAVADFDGDALLDVLFVGTGAMPGGGPSRLHRNVSSAGKLAFEDVTERAGLPGPLVGMGAAVGDADGDGRLDVLVTHADGVRFLRNEGGMSFSDRTDATGFGGARGWCSAATFGDLDGDGDLDVYVCRYVDYRKVEGRPDLPMYGLKVPYTLNPSSFRPAKNLLFRNRGDGTFEGGEALAEALGVANPTGRSLGAALSDFDQDGLPDIYVANDVSDNAMFRGARAADGARSFLDVSYPSATADHRGAMGLAVADPDGDGDDEIFVTHWIAQENAYYRNMLRDARTGGRAMLFMDDADRVGLGAVALDYVGWACDFADFDLDGRPDLFAANGSTLEIQSDRARLAPQRPLVFWNAGPERGWFEAGAAWGDCWTAKRSLRGGAAADLDRDGDVDLVLGALDGAPLVLACVSPPAGRALRVELRDRGMNRFGIGARVTVTAGGSSRSREMRSSPGYASGGPPELVFGFGKAQGDVRVEVRWPDGATTSHAAPEGSGVLVVERP
ncbi:MAG: hypothetical protein HMLKMBBP_01964 [Planctomycetes bacterium]|nr:hypothetical protein [Planctomycetota bacterium]